MTPRSFDRDVVITRLAEMRRLLAWLGGVPSDAASLRGDLGRALAVQHALQVLVDLAVKVNTHVAVAHGHAAPREYRASFAPMAELGVLDGDLAAALAPSAGLRNLLVHEYVDIDLSRVAAAADAALDGYGGYVEQVATWLHAREPDA